MKPTFHGLVFLLASVLGLWGCHSSKELASRQSPDAVSSTVASSGINYRLIYVIHGDANYLYHDEDGKGLLADVQQLKEAKSVGRKANDGEVFIFHQRAEEKILWLFPKKDREFLHYQNGKLVHQQKYSPGSSSESFVTEQQFFQKYKSSNSARQIFLYFGHEIPRHSKINYHHSRSESKFDTEIFTRGIHSFLRAEDRFDLTVLSTCENGTPQMVSKLQPFTRYLLASPQNLHLSHIDSESLLQLQDSPDMKTPALADSVASSTYNRLAGFIQTTITLSIYDVDTAAKILDEVNYQSQIGQTEKENVDCATLPFWDQQKAANSVTVFYKPPNFGRNADQQSYSGWGCQQ